MQVTSDAPLQSPFPVYPVSALRDIAPDILEKTVFTEAVSALVSAIRGYVQQATEGHRAGLAIPVRGDYGTGKTHLLVFAKAQIRELWLGNPYEVTVLSAQATEAPFSAWFLTTVVPLLDHLGLERIFAKLLATVACEVADQVPLTLGVADEIRNDPMEVYPALRDGLLSETDVERGLRKTIAEIAPRGSEELRTVLAALAWPEKQEGAMKWLAGGSLSAHERDLLGVARELDAVAEASSVLVAIAGAAARGGGLFVLMVDEFEHLMAEDRRTDTQRNATTFKRLLEGLMAAGALVVVAGHWRAWEQLPDFKARFGGQPAVDLVTLSGKEIGQLVLRYAPQWGRRLDDDALEAVAEGGGRNIRRVMAVLHQLYVDTALGTEPIGIVQADAAVERRRRLASETARPDAIVESTARALGGRVSRNETLLGRLHFDLSVRRRQELRLLVDVRHAATSADLTRILDDFTIAIRALRARHPKVRGLVVATGAVDGAALSLLDRLKGVDALAGEGPNWEEQLRGAVVAALEESLDTEGTDSESVLEEDEAARESLRQARLARDKEAEATRGRILGIDFGSDERGVAAATLARETSPAASTSVYGPDAAALDSFSESIRAQAPTLVSILVAPTSLPFLLVMVASAAVFFSGLAEREWIYAAFPREMALMLNLYAIVFLFMSVIFLLRRYQQERRAFVRYQRWGRQKLEELLIRMTPSDELLRVKNRLIDAPDASGGFKNAIEHANGHLPDAVRDGAVPKA